MMAMLNMGNPTVAATDVFHSRRHSIHENNSESLVPFGFEQIFFFDFVPLVIQLFPLAAFVTLRRDAYHTRWSRENIQG